MRLRRYLQVHRYEDDVEKQLRAGRKTAVDPYIGHAEAWFDRWDASRYELCEESFKISDQEVLTLLVFTNAEMLEDVA